MHNAVYLKIMYIQNDSQGLIHVLGAWEKIFNECISQTVKTNESHITFPFLNSIWPNLIFELSFVGIHQRLIEIWLSANEYQIRAWSSGGIKSFNKLFITFHWHSQLNLKWKIKTIFSKKLIQKSKKSKNKNRPIISVDGFHYQSFVPQATATFPAFSVIFIRLKSVGKSSVQLNSVVWEFSWYFSISGLTKLLISTFPFPF